MNFLENDAAIESSVRLKLSFFGVSNQIEVLGYVSGVLPRQVAVLCHKCKLDPELYKDGKFRTLLNRLNRGAFPCGCSTSPCWSEAQYKILCHRKAEDVGFTFHGFNEVFRGQKTKLALFCKTHEVSWSETNLINFLYTGGGCQLCRREKTGAKVTVDDNRIISRFLAAGNFPEGTLFSREGFSKVSSIWEVYCPICNETYRSRGSNLRKGSSPCSCGRHSQSMAYIHLIGDSCGSFALKFGVSNNPRRRFAEQSAATVFDVELYGVWKFDSVSQCKRAEQVCKTLSEVPALTKFDFPSGYTETLNIMHLSEVINIYQLHGGVRID